MMTWRTLAEQVTGPAGLIRLLEPSPRAGRSPLAASLSCGTGCTTCLSPFRNPVSFCPQGHPGRRCRIRSGSGDLVRSGRGHGAPCGLCPPFRIGRSLQRPATSAPRRCRPIVGFSTATISMVARFPIDVPPRVTPLAWIEGFRLPDGEPVHIPSDFVWLPDTVSSSGGYPYTTDQHGLECGGRSLERHPWRPARDHRAGCLFLPLAGPATGAALPPG